METTTPQPVCAQEALELLNCAAASPYDRDKCLALLDALRDCIAQKISLNRSKHLMNILGGKCKHQMKVKKFSLAETSSTAPAEAPKSESKP
ncbi:hypothetical protein QOZ80_1BG0049750 [Eleusine coracana subsp. coracana]|nr:hypothetical protein QOZ80_1BG0049750 [Eleusine coracana subsp. coracana]